MRSCEFDALVDEHGLQALLRDIAGSRAVNDSVPDETVRELLVRDWLQSAPGRETQHGPIPIGRCPACRQLTYRGVFGRRYPAAVCVTCEQRATCLAHDLPVTVYERGLRIGDGPASGSHHREPPTSAHPRGSDGSRCPETDASSTVAIDGTTYRWHEARFGGTVIEPVPLVVRVVRATAGRHDAGPLDADVPLLGAPAGRGTLADLERDLRPTALGLASGADGRCWSVVLVPPVTRYARAVGVLDLRGSTPWFGWTEDPSYDVDGIVELRLEPLGPRAKVPDPDRAVLHRDDVHAGNHPVPIELSLSAEGRTYDDLGRALVPRTGGGPVDAFPSVHGGSTWVLRDPYGDARAVGVLDLPEGARPRVLWAIDPQQPAPSALQCRYLGRHQDAEATRDLIRSLPTTILGDVALTDAQVEQWRRRRAPDPRLQRSRRWPWARPGS